MNEVQQIKATTVIECIIDFIIDLNLQKFLSCHQNYSENRWDFGHSKWPCSSFVVPACYEWYPPWFLSDYAECWSHKGQTWELLFSKKHYRRSMCGLYGSQHWKSILYGNNLRINLCLDKASALETRVDSAQSRCSKRSPKFPIPVTQIFGALTGTSTHSAQHASVFYIH